MPERYHRVVAEERAALLGLLGRATGEQWSRPTRCRGWTVKDVVAHLVEAELDLGRVYRGETGVLATGDRRNEDGVEQWRSLPGPAVRAAFWQHGTATQRVLDAIPDDGWLRPVQLELDVARRRIATTLPLRAVPPMHLLELVVHGNDITEALGAEPVWGDRILTVAGWLLRRLPMLVPVDVSDDVRVALEVRGVARVLLERGAWRADDTVIAENRAALEPAAFVLAATGRIPAAHALERAEVEGDREVIVRIVEKMQVL